MPAESIVPPPDIVMSPHEKTPCEAMELGMENESEAAEATEAKAAKRNSPGKAARK